MPLHIPFDGLPVGSLPYRGHIVPVAPKFPAPQDPLHRGLSSEDLPRRDALECLHNPTWRHVRMGTAEQMDVILVRPHRFHLDRKPFRDLGRRLLDNRCHRLIQQRLPVFHGKDNVVVELPRTMRSLSDRLVPLVRHTPEGTRNHCPRSKLRGITSSLFESTLERFQADCGKITDDQKQKLRSTMLDPSDYIFQVDREYTLKALGVHDQLAPLLSSMEWTIMEVPKGNWCFITSDNPVVHWVLPQYHHPFRGMGGLKNKHPELLFPLSPNLCWVGHWLKGAPSKLETTVEWVKQTNRITAGFAERFIYSQVENSRILRLAKKYAASQPVIQMGRPGPDRRAEIRVVRSLPGKVDRDKVNE